MENRLNGMKTEDLEKNIKERVELIKRIVRFVDDITAALGTRVSQNVESSYTHTVTELRGLKDFSFLADTGQSMMGGNDYNIWYHPGKKEIDPKRLGPVFSVSYQVSIEDDSMVHIFDPSAGWQNALNALIETKAQIITEAKKQKEIQEIQGQLLVEGERKRKNLLKRAEELRL